MIIRICGFICGVSQPSLGARRARSVEGCPVASFVFSHTNMCRSSNVCAHLMCRRTQTPHMSRPVSYLMRRHHRTEAWPISERRLLCMDGNIFCDIAAFMQCFLTNKVALATVKINSQRFKRAAWKRSTGPNARARKVYALVGGSERNRCP